VKQNEHGKIIAAAAKKYLAPIGARRKGQSRTWLCDQKYWLIMIEFQPSGWSKGSYLNVGAHWFWYARDHFSFDHGYRIADFVSFEAKEQFEPESERLALRAADEVQKIRDNFRSLEEIARQLTFDVVNGGGGFALYHAAVAAGLVGDISGSRQLFERVRNHFDGDGWQENVRSVAAELTKALPSKHDFRTLVQEIIQRHRSLNKLPPCPDPLPA